jgi:glutamyl/glutaminyl-tRNA synthetase
MEFLFSKENIPVPTMPKELTDENMEAMGKPFLMIRDKYEPLLIKAVALERERISTMSELVEAIKFIIKLPNYDGSLLVWKKSSAEEVKKILPELAEFLNTNFVQEWNKENLEAEFKKWIGEKGYQNGSVLWPLRVALSGQDKSPGPFEIAEVLGKEETISRINLAINKV